MNTSAAHTAEHAFIGSLQKILNKTLSVRKVEHKDPYNTVFIKVSEVELDFEKIVLAEKDVNRLILEGRKILHRSFSSLDEARKELPGLRANEARLANADKDKITVVEIENHDLAACSMEHVSNLSECIFFLVTGMSINGSDYEIRFMVGKNAMDEAVKITEKINTICNEVGANYNTVEATITKLYKEREHYYNQLKKLTTRILTDIPSQHFDKQSMTIISTILDNMDWRIIQTFVGEKILEARTVVILVNTDDNDNDNDTASLVFARSSDVNLDCVEIFEHLGKKQEIGKGGGKPNFINAKIKKSMSNKVVEDLIRESLTVLSL
jgi:alanyl-tRNA synthetase